jgi:DNA-binding XRE family transcriptional regulator
MPIFPYHTESMTLKAVREVLNLSQVELDRRAKLPRGTVQDIESGRNQNPTVNVCSAIADALRKAGAKGVDIESLFVAGKVA